MAEIKTTELPQASSLADSDDIIVNSSGRTKRIRYANIKGTQANWSGIEGKPFDNIDPNYFSITVSGSSSLLTFNTSLFDGMLNNYITQDEFKELKDMVSAANVALEAVLNGEEAETDE